MSTANDGGLAGLLSGLRTWWRGVSRAYCERAVTRSLVAAPLGGQNWFFEVERN